MTAVNLMLDLFLSYEKLLVTSIQDLLVLIKKITEIKKMMQLFLKIRIMAWYR
jgi:hypothetical protein